MTMDINNLLGNPYKRPDEASDIENEIYVIGGNTGLLTVRNIHTGKEQNFIQIDTKHCAVIKNIRTSHDH